MLRCPSCRVTEWWELSLCAKYAWGRPSQEPCLRSPGLLRKEAEAHRHLAAALEQAAEMREREEEAQAHA